MRSAVFVMLLTAGGIAAQIPAFEVATVKQSRPVGLGDLYNANLGTARNGEVTLTNATLTDCIKFAYDLVSDDQVDGAAWVKSKEARFDIVGKASAGASREQMLLMLRTLLAERFHLAMHTEPRKMSHYALLIAKGGPKLHSVPSEPSKTLMSYRIGSISHNQVSMLRLAMLISRQMREMVLDRTGLKGTYEIKLEWTPQTPPGTDSPDTGPSIFTALQEQLGLKLEARKDAVDVLVIDRADRVPVENCPSQFPERLPDEPVHFIHRPSVAVRDHGLHLPAIARPLRILHQLGIHIGEEFEVLGVVDEHVLRFSDHLGQEFAIVAGEFGLRDRVGPDPQRQCALIQQAQAVHNAPIHAEHTLRLRVPHVVR